LDGDRLFQHGLLSASGFEIPHLRQLALTIPGLDLSRLGEARIQLKVGVRPRGLVSIQGVTLSRESLETIGGLVSISLDRAQALEDVAKVEANKEGERLRTLIIDSITHELRTPLTSIKGAASALLANADIQSETRQELLEIINEESDRLNLLVSKATEMAQLDSQQVHMTFEPVEVGDLLKEAESSCSSNFGSHPLTISPLPNLPKVFADPEFINKVLCNLLENAAKYSDGGSPVFMSALLQTDEVAVSVADRGYGIDSSEQTLIFDRFYRARTRAGQATGTGMGLAISKAIIDAHGGAISVTSQLGQGSVFTFTLPVYRQS
jgi:two-component system sensor histidine kinase KdpD